MTVPKRQKGEEPCVFDERDDLRERLTEAVRFVKVFSRVQIPTHGKRCECRLHVTARAFLAKEKEKG